MKVLVTAIDMKNNKAGRARVIPSRRKGRDSAMRNASMSFGSLMSMRVDVDDILSLNLRGVRLTRTNDSLSNLPSVDYTV